MRARVRFRVRCAPAILEGAVAGKALYDGRLNGKEALKLIRAARKAV